MFGNYFAGGAKPDGAGEDNVEMQAARNGIYAEQVDEDDLAYGASDHASTSAKDYHNDSLVGSQISRQARQQLAQYEQTRLCEEIDSNKYVPQRSHIVFRDGYDPASLMVRLIVTVLYLAVVYLTPANSPKEKVDKQWLISFTIVMLIYFTCLHAFAYFPTALFGNFPHCLESALNMRQEQDSGQQAPNRKDHAYCTALLAFLLCFWPLLTFGFLIKQGFDPYEDLSSDELSQKGGTFSPMLSAGRVFCHFCLTSLTVYLIALWATIIVVRNAQRHGDKAWIAKRIRNLPFGSLFFQEGLYFDCGICLQSFWASEEVVGLTCSEHHVFHPSCLQSQITASFKLECNLCQTPVQIAEPDEQERIDLILDDSEAQTLTAHVEEDPNLAADGP